MTRFFHSFLFLLTIVHCSIASDVKFLPEKPQKNSKITVQYFPSLSSGEMNDVSAYLYLWKGTKDLSLIELRLTKDSDHWSGVLSEPLDSITYISCKIVHEKGEDTNNDNWWGVRIHASNGKPVEGALLAEVQSISMKKNNFRSSETQKQALALLEEERKMYPAAPIWTMRWQLLFAQVQSGASTFKQEGLEELVEKELDSLVKVLKREGDILECSMWYDRISKPEKAVAVLDTLVRAYKSRSAAVRKELRPIQALREIELVKTALASIIATYPETPEAQSLQTSMVQIALQSRDFTQAGKYILEYNVNNLDLAAPVIQQLLTDGKEPTLALDLAKRSYDFTRSQTKPPHLSTKEWESANDVSLRKMIPLYASALQKNGKCSEAMPLFREALKKDENSTAEFNAQYVECLKAEKNWKEALPRYEAIITGGNASETTIADFKKAWTEVNGGTKGFDARLKELRSQAFTGKFAELKKSALNKSLNSFTLDDMDGVKVSSEKLRGSVVILDFWATWCGPCKMAFPHLQKVYDKYKNVADVKIYAVNTFERTSGDEKIKNVKNFITSNKYTFPVLFDTNVASENGIQSIPTQYIVDKTGKVQFISVGFEGEKMVEELSAKIDLLRDERFYK